MDSHGTEAGYHGNQSNEDDVGCMRLSSKNSTQTSSQVAFNNWWQSHQFYTEYSMRYELCTLHIQSFQ